MSVLIAGVVKVSLVLLAALAGGALLRHQSAAVRHWVLAVAIACALLMPVLTFVAPSWRVPSVRVADVQVESQGGDDDRRGCRPGDDAAEGAANLGRRRRAPAPLRFC